MTANSLVHIVDADPRICESLSLLFRLEGFETTFSLDPNHFIDTLTKRAPDIAIIDLQMHDGNGISLLKRARHLCPGVKSIMLTDSAPLGAVVAAMKDGAADVVAKPVDHERLLSRVRGVLSANVHVSAGAQGHREIRVSGFKQLTPREREVLQLIVNGMSNKLAARNLGISDRTVEVHRARVMEKLFARNTADLIRIVLSS